MEKNKKEEMSPEDQLEQYLDESGYTMDIPENEIPKSKEEWDRLYTEERERMDKIRQGLEKPWTDMETEELAECIRSKDIEEVAFEWAYFHRKIRSILRKQKKELLILQPTQKLLRAVDLLKN